MSIRPTLLSALGMVLWFSGGFASLSPAQTPITDVTAMTQYVRTDGKVESYFAGGNAFLKAGFDETNRYWSEMAKPSHQYLVRGYLDSYLPIDLKYLDHNPAKKVMGDFQSAFFAAQDPATGLVRHSFSANQSVSQMYYAVEFLKWFPTDASLRAKTQALADATMTYFEAFPGSGTDGGVYRQVLASDGSPILTSTGEPELVKTLWITQMAYGMHYFASLTANRQYAAWADDKLKFMLYHRWPTTDPNFKAQNILSDSYTTTGPHPDDVNAQNPYGACDTDTLYAVRDLFSTLWIGEDRREPTDPWPNYRNPDHDDWVLLLTDAWYDSAWDQASGHYVRKIKPIDLGPWPGDLEKADDRMYGDGKWNILFTLGNAYRLRGSWGDRFEYLDRWKLAWDNYLAMARAGGLTDSKDGLMPDAVQNGEMYVSSYLEDRAPDGASGQQSIFLRAALDAYFHTLTDPAFAAGGPGDETILARALVVGEAMLRNNQWNPELADYVYWRSNSGAAGTELLRLAEVALAAMGKDVHRFELDLGRQGVHLTFTDLAGNPLEGLTDLIAAGDIAVVYLPEDAYRIQVLWPTDGQLISQSLDLTASSDHRSLYAVDWATGRIVDPSAIPEPAAVFAWIIGGAAILQTRRRPITRKCG